MPSHLRDSATNSLQLRHLPSQPWVQPSEAAAIKGNIMKRHASSARLAITRHARPLLGLGLLLLGACASSDGDKAGPGTATGAQPDQLAAANGANATNGAVTPGGIAALQQELVQTVGDRVFFETDHWDLTSADQETLRRQAAWLAQHPTLAITLAGHGDERGTREYNLALGERRATAAGNFLAALGIDRARMTVISYGKEKPDCGDAAESCWSQNRRAVTELSAQ